MKQVLAWCRSTRWEIGRAWHSEEDGYSLTELMIVIVIIGILALLALPRFMNVTTKAKATATEARTMLAHVHSLQRSFRYERDVQAADLAALGFEQERLAPDGGTARSRIAIEQADAQTYLATATAGVDFDGTVQG